MRCVQCNQDWALEKYVPQMDAALEEFLETTYCDRM